MMLPALSTCFQKENLMFTKFLSVLLLLVAFCFATTVATTSGVNYENMGIRLTISSASAYDTIAATDSATLTSDFVPPRGEEILLVHSPFTGSGSDSVHLAVNIDALAADGSVLYRALADTLASANEQPISLPLLGGAKYRIKLNGISGANGGVVILNKVYLYGRRGVTVAKPYD
jgi:hypothetical protein